MRTFYTYEQYAEWRKSSGGAATDGIRLVGSDPSSWPDRYAAQSRIAELEAEVERLRGELKWTRDKLQEAGTHINALGLSLAGLSIELEVEAKAAWNDAIEAAVESVLKKLYLLSIGTPEEGPFTKQDRTRDEVIEQAVESIRALRR